MDILGKFSASTPLLELLKKKLRASCSWDDPALVELLAGGEVTLIEDAEVVQYRVGALITQERFREAENYAKHFKMPFVQAQMQAM